MSKNKTLPFTKVKYNIECNIVLRRLGVQQLQKHLNTVIAGFKRGYFIQTALGKNLFGWSGGAEAALREEPFDLGCHMFVRYIGRGV